MGSENAIKFGMPSDVHDFVTHVNFCQDWSKGFRVARGRILAFSIDLLCRLQNTRTTVRVYDFEI